MKLNTILIPASRPDEPQEPARRAQIDSEGIREINEHVGGYFDIFHFGGSPKHGLFVNDNGLLDGLPANQLATELFHEGLGEGGFLAGPAVMGAFDSAGNTVAPSLAIVDALEGLTIDSDPEQINLAREVIRQVCQWPEGVGLPRTPVRVMLVPKSN